MEVRQLRYFAAVAQMGGFTRASQKLFVAQPALSLQVRQLEREIGTPLLSRHARGVALTPAGSAFLAEAQAILERLDRARASTLRAAGSGAPALTLGFVPSASHVVIPALVRELRRTATAVELGVRELISSEQMDALDGGLVDLGLARLPARRSGLAVAAELRDPFCAAIPAGHPLAAASGAVAVADIEHEPMVAFTRYRSPAFHDQALHACIRAGFSPRLRCEAGTVYSILDLVAAGFGIALVPASCSLLPVEGIRFRPLPARMRSGSLALVTRGGAQPPAVADVVAAIERIFRQLNRKLAPLTGGR